MTDKVYNIRGKQRHNIELTLTLDAERERLYLAAMRERFNKPTWNWSRLVARVLREWYAMYEAGTLPGGE
jgi:hypothetical protein